ncbi:hypothetical protein D9619_009234 [Psilocybe cf. subviscida]|uniref:NACHT domain-containing protein n=1 Tax=Psilocybe cf. subviscida TaxID=2480587 RepID=A0A8H5FA41_9AGAR|nr:hypothetical protein D9619_009234 [Psilocybe cf. subviscida]
MPSVNLPISGGQFNTLRARNVTQTNNITHNNLHPDKEKDMLERLSNEVSTNAFHNSVGRIDAPKCYPGTREEVMGDIEKWISADAARTHWIMWLSGPAGAGKSAIAQSIAERCVSRSVPVASFFFFRTDSTRNDLRPLVATLSYQIACLYPQAKSVISSAIELNPLIFSHSIEDQFRRLILSPLQAVLPPPSALRQPTPPSQPLVIIIDGLDECDTDSKHKQQALIRVLDNLMILCDSPFIVFIASRPEPHLTMSFNQLGSPMLGLFLDEHYRPAQDIRSFVSSEFNKITTSHHLANNCGLEQWPSPTVIDDIISKSSGQFIYAATIMRYISTSSISPVHSLEIVRGLRPAKKNSPFSQIDAIYSYILSRAEDLNAVKDILAAEILRENLLKDTTLLDIVHPLGHTLDDIPSYLSDLLAIVYYKPAKQVVRFYHASFVDFLLDFSRSGQYHIDIGVYSSRVVVEICRSSRRRSGFINFALLIALLKHIKSPTSTLTEEFSNLPPIVLDHEEIPAHLAERMKSQVLIFLGYVSSIYYPNHESSYMALLRLWITRYRSSLLPVIIQAEFNQAAVYNGFQVWNETTDTPSHRSRLKRRLGLLTTGLHSNDYASRSPSSTTDGSSPQSYQSSPDRRSHRLTPSTESPSTAWPAQDNVTDKSPLPLEFYHPQLLPESRWLTVPTIHKVKPWWKCL